MDTFKVDIRNKNVIDSLTWWNLNSMTGFMTGQSCSSFDSLITSLTRIRETLDVNFQMGDQILLGFYSGFSTKTA